jgi:membrane fusion protein, multidrug efflux system
MKQKILWISGLILTAALAVVLVRMEQAARPHTRDAYLRGNVVGIAARIDGQISKLAVRDNQIVKRGDLLFRIDPMPYQARVDQYQADLTRWHARLDDANQKAMRIRSLAEKQLASQEKLETLDDAVRVAKAEIRLTNAELRYARLQLSYTDVYAPANGAVTNFLIRVGSYVKAGETLFALVEHENWWVSAHYMETDLRHIKAGMAAEITLDMYPGKTFHGVVESVSYGIEQADGQRADSGLAQVQETVDWVRLAQRFPVRIRLLDYFPEAPYRTGASAEVTVLTASNQKASQLEQDDSDVSPAALSTLHSKIKSDASKAGP